MIKIIKDICTLANGEDYCIAGISTMFASLVGFLIVGYVFFSIKPTTVSDISEVLKTFAMYQGSIITTGCTGKLLTNKSEPCGDRQ